MPNRILRDWTDSYTINALSAEGERMFVRLIQVVDDLGRFHADPRIVRAKCYPIADDLRADLINSWILQLWDADLIWLYEADFKPYLAIVNFSQTVRQKRIKHPPAPGMAEDWEPREPQETSELYYKMRAGCAQLHSYCKDKPILLNPSQSESESISIPDKSETSESEIGDGNANAGNSKKSEPVVRGPFDDFWDAYPQCARKVARAKCKSLWNSNKLDACAGDIMAGLAAWKASKEWRKNSSEFVPLVFTFLTQERWKTFFNGQATTASPETIAAKQTVKGFVTATARTLVQQRPEIAGKYSEAEIVVRAYRAQHVRYRQDLDGQENTDDQQRQKVSDACVDECRRELLAITDKDRAESIAELTRELNAAKWQESLNREFKNESVTA